MTPIGTETTSNEKKYNVAHKRTRQTVVRCIGVLKSRFRCLLHQRVLCYSPKKSGLIINACAILHNNMIKAKYPINENEIQTDDDMIDEIEIVDLQNSLLNVARNVQKNIVRNYFP